MYKKYKVPSPDNSPVLLPCCVFRDNFRWEKFWDEKKVSSWNYDVRKGPIEVKWFEGGKTNVAYNCLDRHIKAGNGDRIAYFWCVKPLSVFFVFFM